MKKTNRFWVIFPAVVMLFTNSLQAKEHIKIASTTQSEIIKLIPSPLNVAISNGDLMKVKELVENGVDINKRDERGVTPLMFAIMFNQPQIVAYLIGKGSDYRAIDSNGLSVYQYAEKSQSKEIIKLVSDARQRR